MDLKFKKPKWVGSIYHTFEAICHEVDDFVSQETVKFVDNQAQIVGGSMKRFCSKVVQDLLPTSSTKHGKHVAPILSFEQNYKGIEEKHLRIGVKTDENSDLSLNSEIEGLENNKSGILLGEKDQKKELKDNKCEIFFEEIDPIERSMVKIPSIFEENVLREEQTNKYAYNIEKIGSEEEPLEPKEMDIFCHEASFSSNIPETDTTCDIHGCDVERISVMSNSLPPLEMKFPVVSSDNLTVKSVQVSVDCPLLSEISDVLHNEENTCYYLVDENGSASDPADTDMKVALSSSAFGKEDECTVDITDPSMVTIELTDDTEKLDESNVLTENKLLYGVIHRSWKNKSYSKILQDAFASKKRLRKEYEQLGILFGDINIETSKRQEHNLLPEIPSLPSGSGKLPSNDLSEWEIL